MLKDNRLTGKWLEEKTASIYRELGARKVEHDVELAGNQIDVYVEFETTDGALHRVAVEAKDWCKAVGIRVVNDFKVIVTNLRNEYIVDEGVIISSKGFTKQARNAAEDYGIRLLTLEDLQTRLIQYQSEGGQTSPSLLLRLLQVPNPVEDTFSPLSQKIFGAVAGLAIGALSGWLLGMMVAHNSIVGLVIGSVIGFIAGAFMGLQTIWLAVGAYNIVVLGMLIGAALGMLTSAGAFGSLLDIVLFGGLIGLIAGGLTTNSTSNVVEDLFSNTITINIVKKVFSPILGILLGIFLNWVIHQPSILKFRADDVRVNAILGVLVGFVCSSFALIAIIYILVLINSTQDRKKTTRAEDSHIEQMDENL